MVNFEFGGEIVWQPSPEQISQANLTRFMRANDLNSFTELLERSTQDVAWFTDALLKFLEIQFYQPYSPGSRPSSGIAWPRWCVGGQLNIVHNCLDKYIGTPSDPTPLP